jgi:YceI-like domain
MTTVTLPNTVTGDYTIDASHSRIGFVARHAMVTKVRGSFNDFAGSIHFDTANPAASRRRSSARAGADRIFVWESAPGVRNGTLGSCQLARVAKAKVRTRSGKAPVRGRKPSPNAQSPRPCHREPARRFRVRCA